MQHFGRYFSTEYKGNDDVALVTHYPDKGDTCAKISAFFEDSDVETQILYCKQGFENESYAAIQFNEPDEEEYLPDRFVIIENEEQIPHIRFFEYCCVFDGRRRWNCFCN